LLTSDYKKINSLSREVASFKEPKRKAPPKVSQTTFPAIRPRPVSIQLAAPEKEYVFESPQSLVQKINMLEGALDPRVIRDFPTIDRLVRELKSKKLLQTQDIKGMPLNMNDQRWHGGGISSVSHDATLTGQGTPSSPLSVVGASTTFVDNEVVSGSTTTFTLSLTPVVGSVHLYGNGMRLTPGAGNDYTISEKIITTANSYSSGQILADYRT
jgi:hypothetical protein